MSEENKDTAISDNVIKPDFSLIAPYTPEDDKPNPTTIRRYSNGSKELLFINTSHVRGSDNPTCDTIREAIERYHPQRVIIEAEPADLKLRRIDGNTEVGFAANLAEAHQIPVVCAEPDDALILKGLQGSGYSAKDLMALYLLRNVAQDRRNGNAMDEAHFSERAKEYLEHYHSFASIDPKDRLTYEEFKTDYAPRLGGKDFLDADTKDFAPYTTDNATYFQKLHAAVTGIREKLVDTTIADTLNTSGVNRTLVVYGGAHRTISGPVWDTALGRGEDLPMPDKGVAPSKAAATGNHNEITRPSLYDRAVVKITEWVKPYLHRVTQGFVANAVEKYAKDDPHYARMIEFEVRRRGDGAGLTQDVAEPLLWTGIKTLAALAIAIPVEFMKNKKLVLVERVAATSILLNNAVELFRLIPRYKAGLRGSLEMAIDRERAIKSGLGDPFNNQQSPREINPGSTPQTEFAKTVQKKAPVAPVSLTEQAQKTGQTSLPGH